MDVQEKASLAALLASALVLVVTLVLPLLSSPQVERVEGPLVPYGNSTYSISGYYIPTVASGVYVRVDLSGYKPGSVALSLFPTAENSLSPSGSPLVSIQRPTEQNVSEAFVSPATQPYGIYVVSYDKTPYLLQISSSWSSYYVLRLYTYPAVFAVIVCALVAYYFRETAARRRSEREVLKSLRGSH